MKEKLCFLHIFRGKTLQQILSFWPHKREISWRNWIIKAPLLSFSNLSQLTSILLCFFLCLPPLFLSPISLTLVSLCVCSWWQIPSLSHLLWEKGSLNKHSAGSNRIYLLHIVTHYIGGYMCLLCVCMCVCSWQNSHCGVNELKMPLGLTGGQKSMRAKTKCLDS